MVSGWGADRLVSVVVGPGHPYPLADVTEAFSGAAPVHGSLPWDPGAAEVLSDGAPAGRKFTRSAFMRAAGELATVLGGLALDFRQQSGTPRADQRATAPRTDTNDPMATQVTVNGGSGQ